MKIFLSILLASQLLTAWAVPSNFYYFKDDTTTVYMPKNADRCFSLDDNGQPINVTNSTIYGYMSTDTRVYFPAYTRAYVSVSGYNNMNVTFDPDTFETNLNLIETQNKQPNYDVALTGLLAVLVFLQLISFNAFRVRKGSTKL